MWDKEFIRELYLFSEGLAENYLENPADEIDTALEFSDERNYLDGGKSRAAHLKASYAFSALTASTFQGYEAEKVEEQFRDLQEDLNLKDPGGLSKGNMIQYFRLTELTDDDFDVDTYTPEEQLLEDLETVRENLEEVMRAYGFSEASSEDPLSP